MSDQLKRFERWRRILPKSTAFFVSGVDDEIVPLFLQRGYRRYGEYPGKANWLPLQRRVGDLWPTIELHFGHRGRPFTTLHFAMLPEICQTILADGPLFQEISRRKAVVVDAPAFFTLCKGRERINDTIFGDASIFCRSFFLRRKLQRELAELRFLSSWLIDFIDQGIPEEWFERKTGGHVHPHLIMSHSSRIFRAEKI